MNILILTGRFGMGHYSAAEALRQELARVNPEAAVSVVDIIDYMFPAANHAIYNSFNFMVNRCANVYNFFNELAGKHGGTPLKAAACKKLERLLRDRKADLVVATLPLCAQYISAYKRLTGSRIPLYTYITDVEPHREWLAPETDVYFVGAESTRDALRASGVTAEIRVCGVPVRQEFRTEAPRTGGAKKEILIMGGGLGLIPDCGRVLRELGRRDDLHVTVITGANRALLRRLRRHCPAVEAVGFTDRVSEYMHRADLLITKSGGITTFEAIHSRTPMYIIRPFLMQEIGNADYIVRQDIGRVMWSGERDLVEDVLLLLRDGGPFARMRENMARLAAGMGPLCPADCYPRELTA